jgi:hypothetical protein
MITNWVNSVNTTSWRILASTVLFGFMVIVTTVGVTLMNWMPTDMQFKTLLYLGAGVLLAMGLDVTTFGLKRFSDAAYVSAKQGPSPVSIAPPSNVSVTPEADGSTTVAATTPDAAPVTPPPDKEPIE